MIDGVTRRGSSQVFVGRRAELERLEEAMGRAAVGRPAFVLVAGEAGIGKSRFVAEFSERAEAAGATCIAGGCLDLGEGGLPYAPLVEALRALARRLDLTARQAVFGASAEVLAGLIPELGRLEAATDRADPPDPAARQARLLDAVLAVLGRLASERPLIVVIEDIHWADGSTRDLIRFVVRNLRDEQLLVVATYRSDEVHRRHPLMPLLVELGRADRVERLELGRFERSEVGEQLASILGEPPSAALVDALLERSDGLPFYVEELVGGSAQGALQLPSTLRDILGSRLATLSPGSLALVRAASVIGGQFPHRRIAAVVSLDEEALLSAVHAAIDARILVPVDDGDEPAYRFRHALLREAAYDDLLPAERVRLHARLADHLGESIQRLATPDPAIVADFALHAYNAHDLPRALEGSVRALRVLTEAAAHHEALGHAERAIELWPRVDGARERAGIDHADLLALAGRMASAANRPEQAMALTQQALAELEGRGEPHQLAALLADVSWYAWESGAFDASTAAAQRAYELVASSQPSRLKAKVAMTLGSQRWHHLDESVRHLEEAMSIADVIGDRTAWAEAAALLALTRADLGQAARAASLIDLSGQVEMDGDGRSERIAFDANRSIASIVCGRFVDAERFATSGLEIARRYGWEKRFGPTLRACIIDALFELGRYDDAKTIAAPVFADTGGHHSIEWMATTMARVAVAQGRFEDAERLVADPVPTSGSGLDTFRMVAKADLARARARHPDVVAAVDAAMGGDVGWLDASTAWAVLASGIGACADGVAVARRRRKPADAILLATNAERWMTMLRALAERHRTEGGGGPFFGAILATAEAEMSRVRGASDPAAWADAVDQWGAVSHPFQTACAQFRSAEAILQMNGDRTAAGSSLKEAHATAVAIGALPLREDIEALARDARVDLQPTGPRGPDISGPGWPGLDAAGTATALTPREKGVLRLVAGGHTNREIGDQLYISEKTVSVHVSNAMAKLGALSRYEAAAEAEHLGLL